MDEPEAAQFFRAPLQIANPSARTLFEAMDSRSACPVRIQRKRMLPMRVRDRTSETDDIVMIHCNSYVDGFWTDITRTYTLQSARRTTRENVRAVLAARKAALACIKPGVRAADVDAASRRTHQEFRARGISQTRNGAWCRLFADERLQHPANSLSSPDVLQEGMVFNVEPAVYIEAMEGCVTATWSR